MRIKHFFLLLIILVLSFVISAHSQEILSAADFSQLTSKEKIVYSTSFETDEDTAGWYGLSLYNNDVPDGGGTRSAFVSGGCSIPHAWIVLGPFETDGMYTVRCKGKNLENGGMVSIARIEDSALDIYLQVNDTAWTSYETEKKLYCRAGGLIVLSMYSGGIVPGSMLIDMIEVVNVDQESSGWKIISTGGVENYNDVMMLNETTAYVAGSMGSILKTIDAGTTWLNIAPTIRCANGDLPDWRSVRFFDESNGVALDSSLMVITTDGGNSWTSASPPGSDFTCIGNTDFYNLYIGDEHGYVHNSRDTGKAWTSFQLVLDSTLLIVTDSTVFPVRSIFYAPESFDGMTLFALTTRTLFQRVQNQDSEWKQIRYLSIYVGPNSQAFDFIYTAGQTMFVSGISEHTFLDAGPMGLVIRARPMDSQWYQNLIWSISYGILYSLTSPQEDIVYTCGDEGIIYRTEDNGDIWNPQYTGVRTSLKSIDFYNSYTGFAVGDSGTILFTNTGGITTANIPPSAFHLLSPANEDSINSPKSIGFTWSAANDPDGGIVKYNFLISEDSCKTWKSYDPTYSNSINIWGPPPGKYYWTVIANDGTDAVPASEVFSFTIVIIADVKDYEGLPDTYALYRNYPNPFNPLTRIKYDIPVEEEVTIKIYDVLGNEIDALVNEIKKQGSYETEWNAADFPSGVYFCTIKAGGYTNTIKLLLMK